MSHFTVLVPADSEDDLREKLLPYHEYGFGDGEADNDIKELGYVVFVDARVEFAEEYETREIERVVMPDGSLVAPWDDQFKVPDPDAPFPNATKAEIPEHLELRNVPVKELYPTLDEFIEDCHGYSFVESEGTYGYYHNPNDKWDWYQVGGRWTGLLKLKSNGSVPDFDLNGGQETLNKLVFVKRVSPEKFDSVISELKERHPAEDVDKLVEYANVVAQKYDHANAGLGSPGVMTEPSFEPDSADYALAGKIDWEMMKAEDIVRAKDRIMRLERLFDSAGEDLDEYLRLNVEVFATPATELKDCEAKKQRSEIYERIRVHLFETERDEEIDKDVKDAYFDLSFLRPHGSTKEEYLQAIIAQALTHAYIDMDGNWIERGEMGWFGMSPDDNDTFDQDFWKFVESLPDDQMVYLVDCHI